MFLWSRNFILVSSSFLKTKRFVSIRFLSKSTESALVIILETETFRTLVCAPLLIRPICLLSSLDYPISSYLCHWELWCHQSGFDCRVGSMYDCIWSRVAPGKVLMWILTWGASRLTSCFLTFLRMKSPMTGIVDFLGKFLSLFSHWPYIFSAFCFRWVSCVLWGLCTLCCLVSLGCLVRPL